MMVVVPRARDQEFGWIPSPKFDIRSSQFQSPSRILPSGIVLRILHVISAIDPIDGGPPAVVLGFAPALAAAGLSVTVVSTYAAGSSLSPGDELRSKGVPTHLIGPCGGLFFSHPTLKPTLQRLIPEHDIVHVHSMWEDIQHQACRIAREQSVPYLLTPHGMLGPWAMARSRLRKRLYLLWRMRRNLDHAAAIHVTTRIEQQWIAPYHFRAPALVEPLGLDFDEFARAAGGATFRSAFPRIGRRRFVLFLGRLDPQKGLDLLIPAFAAAALDDCLLVLAGPDSRNYRASVQAMVRDYTLEDRVIFTGMLRGPDRIAALREATLMCLPSHHENFGIVVAESLAAGTPVIVSDQVCLHTEISANNLGGVVPLNPLALAAELRRWMLDEPLRRDAAARAPAFARGQFDWRAIAQRWMGHYAEICAASGR